MGIGQQDWGMDFTKGYQPEDYVLSLRTYYMYATYT